MNASPNPYDIGPMEEAIDCLHRVHQKHYNVQHNQTLSEIATDFVKATPLKVIGQFVIFA